MLLPSDINHYSFSLAVSAVTSLSWTTSTLSLKTISRKSWRSNARCSTTTTPGSTSAFTSLPRQDTPSSPWTSSPWKNWTARYTQLTHKHTSIFFFPVVFPFAQKAHTPSPFPLSFPIVCEYNYQCGWNPTSLSLRLVCLSLRRGDLWSFCRGVDCEKKNVAATVCASISAYKISRKIHMAFFGGNLFGCYCGKDLRVLGRPHSKNPTCCMFIASENLCESVTYFQFACLQSIVSHSEPHWSVAFLPLLCEYYYTDLLVSGSVFRHTADECGSVETQSLARPQLDNWWKKISSQQLLERERRGGGVLVVKDSQRGKVLGS